MRLNQTLKSASFKLSAAYAGLFAVSVCILAVLTYFSVTGGLSAQFRARIRSESRALQSDYMAGGVSQVLRIIGERQRGRLVYGLDYSLWDKNGHHLFGSLPDVPCRAGWTTLTGPPDGDEAPGEQEQLKLYVTPLDGEACLLIGDDWGKVQEFGDLILKTFAWISLLSLTMAIVGGLFLSSRFLKRIETINRTAEAIIEGDMKRRVPRRNAPDDLDRLAATLNRMLDRTTSLMESLKHLSNDIAHDLRTPLGRLRQLLEPARHEQLSGDEYRALLDKGVKEIDTILDMFAALLRIAQIESGNRRAGFQRFCLSQLVSDICDTFAPALEEDGRELREVIVPNIWINGDPELLTLSLANLLENANTHTPHSASITVSVCRSRKGIELCVADNGPGVPAQDTMRIFQRFYRLDESRTTSGNGLGLSIVAAVAELHNASIFAADNRPGLRVGMTFPQAA
ncbi:MAG TPA: HAMP domain-containing sensor histidine kinase [Rhizomicrobium sp.]|nr:HAMP domain-containing sensor histidine kinase [Rhizomicrobium sp.]